MRLVDLDPRWLVRDGRRVGFIFQSPTDPRWYQSCFVEATSRQVQDELFGRALDDAEWAYTKVQGCRPDCAWTVASGIEGATFETMTVTPSLDGSAGGLWHGFITNGAIVGGLA